VQDVIIGGSWYASPATHVSYEVINGAILVLAGGGRGSRSTMTSRNGGRASVTSGE
jgi:hypothetical protein